MKKIDIQAPHVYFEEYNSQYVFFFLKVRNNLNHFQNQEIIQVSVSGGLVITALPLFSCFLSIKRPLKDKHQALFVCTPLTAFPLHLLSL